MKNNFLFLAAVLAISIFSSSGAYAGSVLVSQGAYGYGNAGWSNFSALLDSATGDQVSVSSNFENLSQMLGYDALILDVRQSSATLSAAEMSNLAAFRDTGRKMIMFGENTSWAAWNSQILSIAGGTSGAGYYGVSQAIGGNALTQGVGSIWLAASGLAVGGTPLFNQNWATFWGDNVLTLLDINFHSDALWSTYDNAQFASNVAEWIAEPLVVPVPAAIWVLVSGLAGIMGLRRGFRM